MNLSFSAASLFLATAALSLPGIGNAQDSTTAPNANSVAPAVRMAPLYDSDQDLGRVRSSAFNTPEADGRPGEYYFALGVQAVNHKNYRHAIDMYKVAAAWAYKPAEYNLGVMYLSGQGTSVDLPRALAWMALAAERNDPHYVKARDLINRHLNDAQFNQANVIMAQLLPTFGDKVALARAERRWREVRASATGSRVGSAASPVQVGAVAGDPNHMASPYYDAGSGTHVASVAAELAGIHQTDGTIAYQQLRESNNPFDPKFEWHPDASGTVKVGPLKPVRMKDAVSAKKAADSAPTAAGKPY